MKKFTYKSLYGTYENCYFTTGRYRNGNLAVEIWDDEGPVSKVTLNPGFNVGDSFIVVKDYSENEGMVEFLKSIDMIEREPVDTHFTGFVHVPIYKLTNNGISILGLK